jgi:hypothetical protein
MKIKDDRFNKWVNNNYPKIPTPEAAYSDAWRERGEIDADLCGKLAKNIKITEGFTTPDIATGGISAAKSLQNAIKRED